MNVNAPVPVEVGLADRLTAVTVTHRDAQETATQAAKRWKEIVAEAVDAGVPIKRVAELAQVSTARVHRIVFEAYARS